ncbi:MAG: HTH-type transcriptional activator RhaS [Aeromonas sp.]
MGQLHGADFFHSSHDSVAIEPRSPQIAFPEHHHDFYEIVVVSQGTGIHVFNGQPHTLSRGSVCFIRDRDHHLYEQTDHLCLTNVLYRAPDQFTFLTNIARLLPEERDGLYPSHWRLSQEALLQAESVVRQMEACGESDSLTHCATREALFMQLLLLLHRHCLCAEATTHGNQLDLVMAWLDHHFAEEVNWEPLAEQFSLSLRTLHRQLKQKTGLTPQRYLNRLRLLKARQLLRYSEGSVTDIAFQCGFGDSNHFSTLFKKEFTYSPRDIRLGRDGVLQ